MGSTGRVLAVDIQAEMLGFLRERLRQHNLSNVDLILGEEKDPRLPAESIDLALLVDLYHAGIDFTHPDFAMTVRTNSTGAGISRAATTWDPGPP